jgi:hypothetical protein
MEQFETRARARITAYTSAIFVGLASLVFFVYVPFIPDSPILPFLVALALAALSLKNRGGAVAALYLLVFFATLWQMIGFGFFQLLRAGVGVAVLVAMGVPLILFYSRRVELTSMPIGVLCVSLLFTPAYFVSIPLIAAAATVTGFASLEAISLSFVFFAFPFLLLDNALYFVSNPGATTPIAFAQLTYLTQNLRPPLPGLNLFLRALPGGYISPLAPEVSSFLANDWALLVVPLFLIGLIIFLSASAGSLARRFFRGLAAAREWKNWDRLWAPVAVSLTVPAAFVILIVPLSLPGAGGFQSNLTGDASHIQIVYTLASAFVLGLAFVSRELLVERMEGTEIGREKVLDLVNQAKGAMDAAKAEISQIQKNIPVVNATQEEHTLAEHASFVEDVERRAKDSGSETLVQWKERLEKVVLPSLIEVKSRLVNDVLNEFRTLRGVIEAVNGHLREASVTSRYSPIPEVDPGTQMEYLTELYQLYAKRIEDETDSLFVEYSRAFEALNQLLELREMTIPLSPVHLLESHDYVTAMRLVAEDYWLSFHLKYAEELKEKEASLAEELTKLKGILDSKGSAKAEEILANIIDSPPACSTTLLEGVKALRALLQEYIQKLVDYPDTLRKTVESINPAAVKAISFQTARRENELEAILHELSNGGVGLSSLTRILKDAFPVFSGQTAAIASDSEGLSLLAHYPAARRGIKKLLSQSGTVSLDKLPYEKKTSSTFLRLYEAESQGASYDESEGVLRTSAQVS